MMGQSIQFNYQNAKSFFEQSKLESFQSQVKALHHVIHEKTGAGNEFLGWVDLPENFDREEFKRIQEAANKIKSDSEVLLVVGIGGSYLGARAAIEMLQHHFYNLLPASERKTPQIIFVGNNISSTYLQDVIELLGNRSFSINVI